MERNDSEEMTSLGYVLIKAVPENHAIETQGKELCKKAECKISKLTKRRMILRFGCRQGSDRPMDHYYYYYFFFTRAH